MAELRVVEYKCVGCGVTNNLKLWDSEGTPPVMNCMTCGSGNGIDTNQGTIQQNKGMYPTGNSWDREGKVLTGVDSASESL